MRTDAGLKAMDAYRIEVGVGPVVGEKEELGTIRKALIKAPSSCPAWFCPQCTCNYYGPVHLLWGPYILLWDYVICLHA